MNRPPFRSVAALLLALLLGALAVPLAGDECAEDGGARCCDCLCAVFHACSHLIPLAPARCTELVPCTAGSLRWVAADRLPPAPPPGEIFHVPLAS